MSSSAEKQGFAMAGPLAAAAGWKGAELAADPSWIYRLSRDQIAELDETIERTRKTALPLEQLTREHFELAGAQLSGAGVPASHGLPKLTRAIRAWLAELNRGRGFVLVKGFPVAGRCWEDAALGYWAIGRLMGELVPQSKDGALLHHIRDTGEIATNPQVRLYKTNKRQDFHADGSDIVGLLCLRRAKSGGLSRIVSSIAVFNEIRRRRPDLVPLLFEPVYWDSQGEHRPGEKPYWQMPICRMVNGHLRTFYIGWYIRDAQRHPEVPRLTQPQHQMLALIEELANDPAFYLDMDFEPGDIQFLKNSTILHCRTEFEDWEDPERRRHLLRLWISAPDFEDGDEQLRRGFSGKPTTK